MAWGLWNKIKNGFRKAGNVIKSGAKAVVNNVVKPFKPIISAAANAFSPSFGKIVDRGMDAAERFSDEGWGETGNRAIGWASKKFG